MDVNLYSHQVSGAKSLVENKRHLMNADPGCGKTIMSLFACKIKPMKTLVVSPITPIFDAWLKDSRLFPEIRFKICRANNREKRKAIIKGNDWDILAVNYELCRLHVPDLIASGIERLIIDESSYLKNPSSQQTRACVALADCVKECWLLSGTPAPNGEHEYFSQLRCLDRRETGDNFYRWAGRWMFPRKITINGREVIKGWTMSEGKRPAFEDMLRRYVTTIRKEDCLDLPEKVDIDRWVELSESERTAYESMLMTLRAELEGKTIDATVVGKTMKLRQLCGGWLYDGDRLVSDSGHSKLDALLEIIEEIGDRPMIVWAIFQSDLDRIKAELGDKAQIIDGRNNIAERNRLLPAFGREYPYLLAHPQAIGHGVTLVQASYATYYSIGFSLEHYLQSRDRIHRIGQANHCVYFHLWAKDTIDQQIRKVLMEKLDRVTALREALAMPIEEFGPIPF